MRNIRLKHLFRLILAITAVSLLSGCAGLGGSFTIGVRGTTAGPASPAQIGPFENNSRVQLEAARYRENVDIRENKVVLVGRGTGSTVIAGNVRISGNSCTLRDLTVSGDVYLYGNNNNITRADIRGKVISEGNNNRW